MGLTPACRLNPNALQVSVLLQEGDKAQSNSNPIAVGPRSPRSAVGLAKSPSHGLGTVHIHQDSSDQLPIFSLDVTDFPQTLFNMGNLSLKFISN